MADRNKKTHNENQKSSKHYSSGIIDDSCVICGIPHVDTGRILHGHCVCEKCVDYIINHTDDDQH